MDPNNTVFELKRIEKMDDSFLRKIMEMYVEKTTIYISDISRLFKKGDYDKVGSYAHKLYGSSSTLGAIKLAVIAKELEDCMQGEFDSEHIKKQINLLPLFLKEFGDSMEDYLKRR